MIDLILVAAILTTTIGFVGYAYPISRTAIRTGHLLARGIVYSRDANPRMFHSGLAFWLLGSLFLMALSYISIERVFALSHLPAISNPLKAIVSVSSAFYVAWVIWRMAMTGTVRARCQAYGWRERPVWFAGALLSLVLLLLFLLLASAVMIKRLITG